ncbi:septin 5a isoform X1 [Syngnathus typhle]|uniref:septin 5a isoform X1 n=2 Tax=Syngnathus typhle TaxID=161592 RepID=UPI002A6B35C7|nr:septin 5a isoform X1 [Syngnathus typhle]
MRPSFLSLVCSHPPRQTDSNWLRFGWLSVFLGSARLDAARCEFLRTCLNKGGRRGWRPTGGRARKKRCFCGCAFRLFCPDPVGFFFDWVHTCSMDAIMLQEKLVERLLCPRVRTARQKEKQYVGFATLPNQVHRKSVKKGFDFTLMVAGESGMGKSTLVNSLFLTDLYKDRKLLNAEERINQTVEIIKHTVDIEEKGVKLKLTIVDTPGFGDAVNNNECWKAITDYIEQQFEQYFRDESGLNRKNIQDNRVHCCLYFIPPFGHGLRPVDVEFMKALHEKVNIIPLIAKADCLTPSEIKKLKDRIRDEIDKFAIKVYQFPECDSDEDEEFKQLDKELKECTPFAVIGSNTVVEARGQRVRGRLYPWGIVEVENQSHCDFVKLRNMLIRSHMHDLKDVTCDVHYENYRAQCIQEMTSKLTQDNRMESPIPILPLATPDADTEKLIKMKDEELKRMQEMLTKMQQQMHDKD